MLPTWDAYSPGLLSAQVESVEQRNNQIKVNKRNLKPELPPCTGGAIRLKITCCGLLGQMSPPTLSGTSEIEVVTISCRYIFKSGIANRPCNAGAESVAATTPLPVFYNV